VNDMSEEQGNERINWSVRPHTRGNYEKYVIGTARAAGVAGFLFGGGLGIFLYLGLSMYNFSQLQSVLGMFGVALFTGGISMLFTLYRESEKWDTHDTVESERMPNAPIIHVDGQPDTQKDVKLSFWVQGEYGSEQLVKAFRVQPAVRLQVRAWLLSMAAQTETNVTRDHAWQQWNVDRKIYNAWRTIIEDSNGIIKSNARNSPVILNDAGRALCAYMGANVEK